MAGMPLTRMMRDAGCPAALKAEARSSKPERRPKPEIRVWLDPVSCHSAALAVNLVLRISAFFRSSVFGLQFTADGGPTPFSFPYHAVSHTFRRIGRAIMDNPIPRAGAGRFLPRIGSPAYHVMLAGVAILILGPLGGISAAFMNFSIGFFIGGQVLAGILGSTVTLPYGPEGRHGANYMQTMAASVAGMCGMAVLVQAMVWLGLPEPPAWKLVLYFMSIGMFGVGIGMLNTPVLVDRMQLAYPSGYAVANILRALTDKNLLKRSIAKLGGGMFGGYVGGLFALKLDWFARFGLSQASIKTLEGLSISTSTFGAGMIVGARIAIPALVVGLIGIWQTPHLVSIGWLKPGEPFRKIGFIIALGTILGAAILDLALILTQAARRFRQKSTEPAKPAEDWKRFNMLRLVLGVAFWGTATVLLGSQVLPQP